jgi:hypothetical protein
MQAPLLVQSSVAAAGNDGDTGDVQANEIEVVGATGAGLRLVRIGLRRAEREHEAEKVRLQAQD